MFMYIFFGNKFVGRRSVYNACYGRHTTHTATAIQHVLRSPYSHLFHLILKGIFLERKINMIKWKKKSCVERKNNILQQKDKGMWREKRMYQNGRINVSKQKKKLNSDFWKTIMKEFISFNFLCFQREFYPKFKPFLLC